MGENVDSGLNSEQQNPEKTRTGVNLRDRELQASILSYYCGLVYGALENYKVVVEETEGWKGLNTPSGRATGGLEGLIDQNTGDGIFVAINTFGADIFLGFVNSIIKKLAVKV